jgi:hypothetical protein
LAIGGGRDNRGSCGFLVDVVRRGEVVGEGMEEARRGDAAGVIEAEDSIVIVAQWRISARRCCISYPV